MPTETFVKYLFLNKILHFSHLKNNGNSFSLKLKCCGITCRVGLLINMYVESVRDISLTPYSYFNINIMKIKSIRAYSPSL